MSPATPEEKIVALRRSLVAKRSALLSMTPENALGEILNDPQPAALVHAFPEEDLHILVHEIGLEDALPLLALASHRQLEYLLDKELWLRDRLDFGAAGKWFARLLRADAPARRLVQWLAEKQSDLVELFLGRSIEVRMREHDQDPSVFGPDFFTYDNVYYIRIIGAPPSEEGATAAATEARPRDTVKRLLDELAENDYVRFQALVLEAVHLLPSETEEEVYRLRSGRLAEKGFLPFDEAVGLYQPLNEQAFSRTAQRRDPMLAEHPDCFPLVPAAVLPEDNLFTQALAAIDSPEQRQTLQEEFAALCNRIIVADGQTIHRREELAAVVAKASGYLSIGLEKRQRSAEAARGVATAVKILQRYHLEGLFRLGYHEALRLKQAAEKWARESWFAARGLPLTFWDEQWMGIIGGLLIKRPLFFDNYQSGTLYREFAKSEDIAWTRSRLEQVQTFDTLLSRLHDDRAALPKGRFLTYKSLLLTRWARCRLSLPEVVEPLPLAVFRPFFKTLFQPAAGSADEHKRRIPAFLKEDFLRWLAARSQEPPDDLAAAVGASLAGLFEELEEHYGRIRPEDIDPRYIVHFLLRHTPAGPHPR